jgi:hypothetical protein
MKDYCYLVTIDVPAMMRSIKSNNKYAVALLEMFPGYDDALPYTEPLRYAMDKEQLALFLYLRCRAGGANGIRDLDMKRAAHDVCTGYQVDLRGTTPAALHDEPRMPTLVELAKQLTKVYELLDKLAAGTTMNYDGLPLNSEHMTKVLEAQRAHLRAQVIAATAMGV